MKRLIFPACLLTAALTLGAQTRSTADTTVTRTVTVERDFQPVIQNATKQNQSPAILQEEIVLNPVVYSTYSESLPVGFNVHALPAAETTFSSQSPLQGMVDGALGHRNTHFAFGYRIAEKKRMSLDLFANHDAWVAASANAHYIWYYFAAIGLISAVLLLLFAAITRYCDRRK